uniref:Uncharacterized protein n=1 Tax=Plectus sambesii TaxID=2011161 RepID=A0A914W9Y7_9BILA
MGNADQIVQGFTRETSIHGLLRICSHERRWCARGIWVVLFVAASAAFVYQAQELVIKFFSFPSTVTTTLQFQTLEFPAVTICNQNPFRLNKIPTDSEVAVYQARYKDLLKNGMNVDPASLMEICQLDPLLCYGISMEVCSDDYCTDGIYGPSEGSDECYGWNEDGDQNDGDCGSNTINKFLPSQGPSQGQNTNNREPKDSTNSSETGDSIEETHDLSDSLHLRRQKRDSPKQVSVSMLQLNTKVASDMNYMVESALRSGDQDTSNQYKDIFEVLTELIEDCSYGTQQCNLSSNFIASKNPVFGMCFTFNHKLANMTNMTATRAGPAFGLRLRINVRQSQYLHSTDTAGVRVAVHHQDEAPFPRCLFSCLAIKIVERCGCMHYNYPQLTGSVKVKINSQTYTADANNLQFCNQTMKSCADSAENDLLVSGRISADTCGCNPSCYEINYQTSISTSTFPSDMYMETINCPRNASNGIDNSCYDNITFNGLILEVFYMQLNFQRYNMEKSYTLVQLISDLGGQLGLWIGASVLSIAEFFSFVLSIAGYGMKLTKHDVEMKSKKVDPAPSDVSM